MANNKEIREQMIKKYGNECWIEDEGIRYVPDLSDLYMNSRSEEENKLTYHHIKPVSKGGETTEENGAILRNCNHQWLESLSKEEREDINWRLKEYKAYRDLLLAGTEYEKYKKNYEEIRKQRKEFRQKNRIEREEER